MPRAKAKMGALPSLVAVAIGMTVWLGVLSYIAYLQLEYKRIRNTPECAEAKHIADLIHDTFYREAKSVDVFFDLDEYGTPTLFVCGLRSPEEWAEARKLATEERENRGMRFPLKMLFFESVPKNELDLGGKIPPIHVIEL